MDNHAASGGDLARLIEAEQRLEETLARARADAGALVEGANLHAATTEVALEQELREAEAQHETVVQAESARRVADVEAEGRRAAAEIDAVPESRIAEFSARILRDLIGGGDGQ